MSNVLESSESRKLFSSPDSVADEWAYWMQQPLSCVKSELLRHRLRPPSWVMDKSQLVEQLISCLNPNSSNTTASNTISAGGGNENPSSSETAFAYIPLAEIPAEEMLQQMDESGLCRMLLTDPGEITHCLDRSMLIARVKGRWRNYQNQKKIKSQSSTERVVKHKCIFCDRREADQINIPCGHVLNCARCQPHGSQCGLCSAPVQCRIRIFK